MRIRLTLGGCLVALSALAGCSSDGDEPGPDLTCTEVPVPGLDVIYSGTSEYETLRVQQFHEYVLRIWAPPPLPWALSYPKTNTEISEIVMWAKHCGRNVCIRNGGVSYERFSLCDDGLVIDVGNFTSMSYDDATETMTVGAGNTAFYVHRFAYEQDPPRAVPGPAGGVVGIAGGTLGGAFAISERMFGLGIDVLEEVTVILADGSIVTANSTEHPHLYWASRGGGGGSFGVVTELKFKTFPAPEQTILFNYTYPDRSQLPEVMSAFTTWNITSEKEFFIELVLSTTSGYANPMQVGGLRVVKSGETVEEAQDAVRDFLTTVLADPSKATISEAKDWLQVTVNYSWPIIDAEGTQAPSTLNGVPYKATSHMFESGENVWDDADFADEVQAFLDTSQTALVMQFDNFGGQESVAAQAPNDATAFPWRDSAYSLQYINEPTLDVVPNQLYELFDIIDRKVRHAAFRNYSDRNLTRNGTEWTERYFGDNLTKLMEIKTCYDKDDFFNFDQSVPLAPKPIADCPL